MQRRNATLLLVGLAVAMFMGDSRQHSGAEAQSVVAATQTTSEFSMPAGSAGQVLSLDSVTGKPRAAQATSGNLAGMLGDAVSTSSEGLVEAKNPVAAGGYKMDLQGRFQNAVTATVDANGNLTAPCVSGPRNDAPAGPGEVK